MERRAVVVQQAGNGELAGPRTAAYIVGPFEHLDGDPVLSESHRRRKPVGPRPDHDRRWVHARSSELPEDAPLPVRAGTAVAGLFHSTSKRMGPSGSHGCWATASATRYEPRSITPK